MRHHLSLLIVLVTGLLLTTVQEARSQAQDPDFLIIRDKNSLSIYVPKDQTTPLDRLQFQYVDEYHKTAKQSLQAYSAFSTLSLVALPTPICLALLRTDVPTPLPMACQALAPTQVFQQKLVNADVFWYDEMAAQLRPINVVLGTGSVGLCLPNLSSCRVSISQTGVSVANAEVSQGPIPITIDTNSQTQIPTEECPGQAKLDVRFDPVWPGLKSQLGCIRQLTNTTSFAYTSFEHGRLVWRGMEVDKNQLLVLHDDSTWQIVPRPTGTFTSYCPALGPKSNPFLPTGELANFLCQWSDVNAAMGRAIDAQQTYVTSWVQQFDHGFLLHYSVYGTGKVWRTIVFLYGAGANSGTWREFYQ